MTTHYIRYCMSYDDPVWGLQSCPWCHSGLIRVTRNSLQRAQFEWVGNKHAACDIAEIRRQYPIAFYA